jgi:hypothetical protein
MTDALKERIFFQRAGYFRDLRWDSWLAVHRKPKAVDHSEGSFSGKHNYYSKTPDVALSQSVGIDPGRP